MSEETYYRHADPNNNAEINTIGVSLCSLLLGKATWRGTAAAGRETAPSLPMLWPLLRLVFIAPVVIGRRGSRVRDTARARTLVVGSRIYHPLPPSSFLSSHSFVRGPNNNNNKKKKNKKKNKNKKDNNNNNNKQAAQGHTRGQNECVPLVYGEIGPFNQVLGRRNGLELWRFLT